MIKKSILNLVVAVCVSFAASNAVAALVLNPLFQDTMVLQREMPVPIWGTATPASTVTVRFAGQEIHTTADAKGQWLLKLAPLLAQAEPQELIVSTEEGDRILLQHVLVGEVWFCSGQSNMAFPISRLIPADAAEDHPLLQESHSSSFPLVYEYSRSWKRVDAQSILSVSGTAYFFAKSLYAELQVPIGIINSSHGSSPLEAWTCRELVEQELGCRSVLDYWQTEIDAWDVDDGLTMIRDAKRKHVAWLESVQVRRPDFERAFRQPANPSQHPFLPGMLYKTKVLPFIPFAIRGVIWYQGESNASSRVLTGAGAQAYASLFPAMIRDWRAQWQRPTLPFYFVQLASFGKSASVPGDDNEWAALRDAQLKTLSLPATGMVVTMDIGDAKNIHPWNKIDLGDRLARWALNKTYSDTTVVPSGPLFKAAKRVDHKMILAFDYVGSGLVVGQKTGVAPRSSHAGPIHRPHRDRGQGRRLCLGGCSGRWSYRGGVQPRRCRLPCRSAICGRRPAPMM